MKRRDVLTLVAVSTSLAGCSTLGISAGCEQHETAIEELEDEQWDGMYDEDGHYAPENEYCIGGKVTTVDASQRYFEVDDGTGTAGVMSPHSIDSLDEGDCVNVCGGISQSAQHHDDLTTVIGRRVAWEQQ